MGALLHRGTGERVALRGRSLLGRSAACDVRVDDPRISGEHASLCWTSAGWEIRDLASKNGTFVDGRRLASRERALLATGSAVDLGVPNASPGGFVLVDATPPPATATQLDTGVVRRAAAGLLLLPDEEQPRVSLMEADAGRWKLEALGETRWVSEGEIVLVDGERWRLDLPVSGATVDANLMGRTIETISLRFGVSRDEEHVEISVVGAAEEMPLPPRSCQYLLLTLARARLSAADVPPADRGWLERDALCRMLKMDEYRLNVDVCRARKQFASLGIHGAGDIVQRRMRTGRLRLGVERVSIRQL
jgi:hypothetical protein